MWVINHIKMAAHIQSPRAADWPVQTGPIVSSEHEAGFCKAYNYAANKHSCPRVSTNEGVNLLRDKA